MQERCQSHLDMTSCGTVSKSCVILHKVLELLHETPWIKKKARKYTFTKVGDSWIPALASTIDECVSVMKSLDTTCMRHKGTCTKCCCSHYGTM